MRKLGVALFSILILWALSTVSCQTTRINVYPDGADSEYSIGDTYTVSFVDDNAVLSTQIIGSGDVASEYVPKEKEGYTFVGWTVNGKPFDFGEKITKDTVLTAQWRLNEYVAEFIADDKVIGRVSFTVEDKSIEEPPVPKLKNYDGIWEAYELGAKDIRIGAIYTPTAYEIRYFADNVFLEACSYNVLDYGYSAPPVPAIDGFEGYWKTEEIRGNIVIMVATYEPKQYTLIFKADGKELAVLDYKIGDIIDEPQPPQIAGYEASWQYYETAKNEITIVEAVYTPITYHAYFFADGNPEYDLTFTVESKIEKLPSVPAKEGYTSRWENFSYGLNDIAVNAVYTPIDYTATFIAEDTVVAVITFNAEDKDFAVPAIIPKAGYTCKWEDFNVQLKDFEVRAVYTPLNDEDFIYEPNKDGSAYIVTEYRGESLHVKIPQFYNGLPVAAIGEFAFAYDEIESVEISYGIETIEPHAFRNCIKLKSVTISETVEYIGEYAFADCTELTEIQLPASVKLICPYVFDNCSALQTIEFDNPNGWYFAKNLETGKTPIPGKYFSDSRQNAVIYPDISAYYLIYGD